jgi:ubiquinone/menaquinone biosynthesis C-methylase UbiE/DNA-binding MarR family transcriptional regulator
MTLTSDHTVEILRAAGEPTRLRILALLATEELSVLELCRILDQSQPRVSRHLKLLAEAGLVERFPDGAWVFYRLIARGPGRMLVEQALDLIDPADATLKRDAERLTAIHAERSTDAAAYFARNAARWDEIRSLHVAEDKVERAILTAAGKEKVGQLVDLGAGTGRMLTLLGDKAERCLGLDLSQQMLNIARSHTQASGLNAELRHGDIFATRLPDGFADLVTVHQVLHYLSDPAAAVAEAARLVAPGGKLLIIDFAPHDLEFLRAEHRHRRLGFFDNEIERWASAAGLAKVSAITLPPAGPGGLTVKVWIAEHASERIRRVA